MPRKKTTKKRPARKAKPRPRPIFGFGYVPVDGQEDKEGPIITSIKDAKTDHLIGGG